MTDKAVDRELGDLLPPRSLQDLKDRRDLVLQEYERNGVSMKQ